MNIPPSYSLTPDMIEIITHIQAHKLFFSSITLPTKVKDTFRKRSFLKSSLFSARIEGNTLTFDEFEEGDNMRKKEIFNILEGYEFIEKNVDPKSEITKDIITKLHKIVMKDLSSDTGAVRNQVSAIFNQEGYPIYIPPPPTEVSSLLYSLLSFINGNDEKFPLVNAIISHLVFEKIHPFIDGNGRVGRLLIFAILRAKGEEQGVLVPFEEYLEEHRDEYYFYLSSGLEKPNDFLYFMLKSFFLQTEKTKKELEKELVQKDSLLLPPRQNEIYLIVKEHRMVSFDMIKRRFVKVPERTLRYDLKKLCDQKLVTKIGTTKGSYYTAQ